MVRENPWILDNKNLDACRSSNCLGKGMLSLLQSLNQHAVMEVTDRSTALLYAIMISSRALMIWNFKIPEGQSEEFDLTKCIKIPEKDQTEVYNSEDVLPKLLQVVTE